jgi:hypothetical protein
LEVGGHICPPYDDKKVESIDELHLIMGAWQDPTLMGGDFNIVRS